MASTYEPIATSTVSGSSTSVITFSSIPSTYTDLVLIADAKLDVSGQGINLTFNSDTATNYSSTRLYGNGSSASSDRQTNGTYINFALGSVDAGQLIIANIMNYSNATTYKTTLIRQNTASAFVGSLVGLWRATPAAITRIDLTSGGTSKYVAGSTFTLYGIKAA
jgi:hypothetical protein